MIRYHVSHRTAYRYGRAVTDAYSVACLLPRPRVGQQVVESSVWTEPDPDEFDERVDVFGNRVVQLGVHRPHEEFEIIAESVVDVEPQLRPETSESWEAVAARASNFVGDDAIEKGPYRAWTAASTPSNRRDLLDALARSVFFPRRPVVDAVVALSHEIFNSYAFDPMATDWATPLDTVLENRRGVCQDFAHLATAVLRSVGLPASYVSGYIETDPPPGEAESIGADASHAWCSVWTGDTGWLDLDPTNDQVPATRHVTVAWGRDYADVAPVRGVVLGPTAHQSMTVAVDMTRLAPQS